MPTRVLTTARARRSGPNPAAAWNAIRDRLVAGWMWPVITIVAAACGVGLVYLPPLLIAGAIIGIGCMAVVLVRPYFGLVAYTITFLIRPGELMPVLEHLHVERLIGLITIFSMTMETWRRTGKIFVDVSTQTKWLVAFVLTAFATIPISFWPGLSRERAVDIFKILMFYFMILKLIDTRARLQTIIWVYMLCLLYLSCYSLKEYYSGNLMFAQGIERVVGVNSLLGDPNQLGTTMAVTFTLLIVMLGGTTGFGARLLVLAGALTCVWSMSLTGSRASTLGFLTALTTLWWRGKHRFFTAIIGIILLAGAFSVLPEQYKERYSTIGDQEIDESSQGRIDAWKAGVRMVVDRPILGVGVGAFGVAHALAYSEGGNWLQPHSLYVQVPSEVGFLGAFFYFGYIFQMIQLNRRTLKTLRRDRPGWRFEMSLLQGMHAGLLCLITSGIFGHSMLRETWYIYGAFGLAIYRLHIDLPPEPAGMTPPPRAT